MATRKKVEEKPITLDSYEKIAYSGNVDLVVKAGDKIIKKYNLHNRGGNDLFKFIALSLSGSYSEAENYRPFYVCLFSNEATWTSLTSEPLPTRGNSTETDQQHFSNGSRCSALLGMSGSPVCSELVDAQNKIIGWETKISFMIPFSLITADSSINQISLYSKDTSSVESKADYCAYYYLMSETEPGYWKPISTAGASKSYSIYLEWRLKIQNK